jgi:hypothetical protein
MNFLAGNHFDATEANIIDAALDLVGPSLLDTLFGPREVCSKKKPCLNKCRIEA